MTPAGGTACDSYTTSVNDCIAAQQEYNDLFEETAACPQMCIYDRFGKESVLAITHLERKVHRCRRAVESFNREKARLGEAIQDENEGEGELSTQYEEKMDALVNAIFLRSTLLSPNNRLYPC